MKFNLRLDRQPFPVPTPDADYSASPQRLLRAFGPFQAPSVLQYSSLPC